MKATILKQTGSVENFSIQEIKKPEIQENEVLVEIKALSINPVDYKVRGNEELLTMIYGSQRPAILGWDIAGIVSETGSQVKQFSIGDKVFGMVNFPGAGNAYAEYVNAPVDHLARIPGDISFGEAAASTLAALTALQVLKDKVKKGDRVLIHAGSGGVGHFAIQIAKHLGAFVISTSSAKNKDFIMSLGADEHIDYRAQAFQDILSDMDFVFDMFNGDILLNSVKVVKKGGTIVSIPTPEFSEEIKDLATERGVELIFHMVQSDSEDMETIANLLDNGIVKAHISERFSFENIANAHKHLESGRTVGKVVVDM
ncbi:MAG: NADP-dependent oxidoreductase [Saprospiraceae bacterium]|nr:NADP-dependent oxidoreductase [Saprospiraceae bacterium]